MHTHTDLPAASVPLRMSRSLSRAARRAASSGAPSSAPLRTMWAKRGWTPNLRVSSHNDVNLCNCIICSRLSEAREPRWRKDSPGARDCKMGGGWWDDYQRDSQLHSQPRRQRSLSSSHLAIRLPSSVGSPRSPRAPSSCSSSTADCTRPGAGASSHFRPDPSWDPLRGTKQEKHTGSKA